MDNLGSIYRGDIEEIAKMILQKQIMFLCGAGMSKASKLPLGDTLRSNMINKLMTGATDDDKKIVENAYTLEAIASAYEKKFDPARLNSFLRDCYLKADAPKHKGHDALEFLAAEKYIDRIYTTNFDQLIEESIGERSCSVTDDNAFVIHKSLHEDLFPVIHLHGIVKEDESTKPMITEIETYKLNTPLSKILMADMVTHWFVFIGYSMSDSDLRSLYLSMLSVLSNSRDLIKRPYVVYPLKSKSEISQKLELEMTRLLWDSRGIGFIPMGAEEFLPSLVDEVRKQQVIGIVEKIVLKINLSAEAVWDQIKNLGKLDNIELHIAAKILAKKYNVEGF